MPSFTSQLKTAENSIRSKYREIILRPVNEHTESYLEEYIVTNMYRAYEPVKYVRTYKFLNSISKKLEESPTKMESLVYFDNDFLDHTREGRRVYVPYLVQINEPKRVEAGWRAGAKRDTSFYAQTTLAMMKAYNRQKRLLRGRRIIY